MGVNRTFFDQVAHALPGDDDLLLVGAGEVVEHFADHVRTDDENHGRKRRIEVEKSGSVTERQLLGRIRTSPEHPPSATCCASMRGYAVSTPRPEGTVRSLPLMWSQAFRPLMWITGRSIS